jgi:hypothetical protein
MVIQYGTQQVPGGFDFLHLPLPPYPMTLRRQLQSTGQLHDWLGGVVRTRFLFSFLPRLRAHILGGPTATLSCGNASPLCLNSGTGEEVVWSGDVWLRQIAAVQLCMSLQKVLQLSSGVIEVVFNKKKLNTHRFVRISRGKQCWHIWHDVHVQ